MVLNSPYSEYKNKQHQYSVARVVNSFEDIWIGEDALFLYKGITFLLSHPSVETTSSNYFILFISLPSDDPTDVGAFSVNILLRFCKGFDIHTENDLINGCDELIIAEIHGL